MAFGIAAFESALLDLAVDALTDCNRPVPAPSRRYRYHGEPAVQCCDDDGVLYAFWNPALIEPRDATSPPVRRTADVFLRLYRCFPVLQPDGHAPEGTDEASEGLSNDMDCITSALIAAMCSGDLAENLTGCTSLAIIGATPRQPRGGCAGVQWQLRASWKPWVP